MITELRNVWQDGILADVLFLIDGKVSAILVDYSETTSVGIFLKGASRELHQGMLKTGMPREVERVDLTHVYNSHRIGCEPRLIETEEGRQELIRDVMAQGYTLNEILNGVGNLDMSRIKNPRLLIEQPPEMEQQDELPNIGTNIRKRF